MVSMPKHNRVIGEVEYDLRVFRLPRPAARGDTRLIRDPPEALKLGFEAADKEYHRILDTIDAKYYHELAVPAHFQVEEEAVNLIRSALQLDRSFPGVFGPHTVAHDEKVYKVWIQVFPCG